jgi:hypothetical protein
VNSGWSGDLHDYIQSQASSAGLRTLMANVNTSNATNGVCIAFPNGASPKVGDPVEIKVYGNYTFVKLPIGIGAVSHWITGDATMRLEQTPSYTANLTGSRCPEVP